MLGEICVRLLIGGLSLLLAQVRGLLGVLLFQSLGDLGGVSLREKALVFGVAHEFLPGRGLVQVQGIPLPVQHPVHHAFRVHGFKARRLFFQVLLLRRPIALHVLGHKILDILLIAAHHLERVHVVGLIQKAFDLHGALPVGGILPPQVFQVVRHPFLRDPHRILGPGIIKKIQVIRGRHILIVFLGDVVGIFLQIPARGVRSPAFDLRHGVVHDFLQALILEIVRVGLFLVGQPLHGIAVLLEGIALLVGAVCIFMRPQHGIGGLLVLVFLVFRGVFDKVHPFLIHHAPGIGKALLQSGGFPFLRLLGQAVPAFIPKIHALAAGGKLGLGRGRGIP